MPVKRMPCSMIENSSPSVRDCVFVAHVGNPRVGLDRSRVAASVVGVAGRAVVCVVAQRLIDDFGVGCTGLARSRIAWESPNGASHGPEPLPSTRLVVGAETSADDRVGDRTPEHRHHGHQEHECSKRGFPAAAFAGRSIF